MTTLHGPRSRDDLAPVIVVGLGIFFALAALLAERWPVPAPVPAHNPNLVRVEAPPRMARSDLDVLHVEPDGSV